MLNKTKKVAFLTTGLAGALVVSSAVGIALSSCTTSNTSSSDTSNKFTYSIDWTDQDQLKQLTIDEQGLVYSSADKSEIITVAPNTAATSFVIPASVKYITGYNLITRNSSGAVATSTSYGAFQDQTSLISITFASSDTLISIGDSSFKGCTYLSSITLPSSTTVVYNSAFENCTNLRNIGLANVSYIGSAAFKNAMANGADVSIDLSSATYIGNEAFSGSTTLANVDFSKNTTLTYIGISAFSGALVSGDSVTSIDLSKATLLKTISDKAFQNCTNLGSVVLSTTSALTTIGNYAFSGATSLTQVGSAVNTFTAPSSLGNYATTTANSTTYVSSGIGTYAFANTKITAIDLSAATTATTPFTSATFKNMAVLASVNFGSSSKITTIPYSLFENDSALTSLTLPASITSIANGNDTTATDGKSPFYNSGLQTIDMSAIKSYATGTTTWNSVRINNTTMLPVGLFQNLTSLTTVTLKTGTVVIGDNAFNGASSLATVKENTTSTIADEASGSGLVISSTMQMINANAFQGTGIETVTFASESNNSLWFIGQGAFQNATSLKTVSLSSANTSSSNTIATAAFSTSGDTTTTTITGFYGISSNTFSDATALTTVELPASLNTIYTSAFVNNTALSSVNFNTITSLNTIQEQNFIGASALATIDLSANSNFTSITTATNIFTGLPENASLKLPSFATSLNSTSFLVGTATSASLTNRPSITYGGETGLNILLNKSSVTISGQASQNIGVIGNGSSTAGGDYLNTMLQYISNDYDLTKSANVSSNTNSVITSGADIGYYYPWTFFGNTKLTSLTMSASKFVLEGTTAAPTQATKLFFINASSSSNARYAYANVPFGDNTALNNFTFTGFDVDSSVDLDTTTKNNPLYKTTLKTWAQVDTIINKFASNSITTMSDWTSTTSASDAADTTTKIQYDSVFSGSEVTASGTTSYQVSVTSSYESGVTTGASKTVSATFEKLLTDDNTTNKTLSFIHNGITWTLTITPKTSTTEGSVTLVGNNINIYKGSVNSINKQIPFATTTTGSETTANTITVTLNII